jgi:hypothetical protein
MRPSLDVLPAPPVLPALVVAAALALAGCSEDPLDEIGRIRAVELSPVAEPTPPDTVWVADVTEPVQGGDYVAVVLATGGRRLLDASTRSVAAYGYAAGTADVGCLDGAAEALDLRGGSVVSYLLFGDDRDARRFGDAYVAAEDGLMVGRARVTTYCLD